MIDYEVYVESRRLAPRIATKLRESDDPKDSLDYWQNQIALKGVEYVESMLAGPLPVSQLWYIPAQYAVDQHYNNLRVEEERIVDRKNWSRDRLALEAVDHAREASPIATKGVRETRNSWVAAVFVGVAVVVVMIWAELRS